MYHGLVVSAFAWLSNVSRCAGPGVNCWADRRSDVRCEPQHAPNTRESRPLRAHTTLHAAPTDVFMVHGLFAQTLKPPLTPGSEGVGTVASFSERFSVGQRVVAGASFCCCLSYTMLKIAQETSTAHANWGMRIERWQRHRPFSLCFWHTLHIMADGQEVQRTCSTPTNACVSPVLACVIAHSILRQSAGGDAVLWHSARLAFCQHACQAPISSACSAFPHVLWRRELGRILRGRGNRAGGGAGRRA